jgi:hypothetical protein
MKTKDFTYQDHIKFWELVNKYCEFCGGKPDEFVYGNTERQEIVRQIEELIF